MLIVGDIRTFAGIQSNQWSSKVYTCKIVVTSSDDDQIRFEEEIAGISAERDAIEKARLTLLEDHQKLKAETVRPIPLPLADDRNDYKNLSRQQKHGPEMQKKQPGH
jgi:hypothetical protein